ncbi:MAG TPA: N-acetyl-gamma-glutamyl-phosphate reductase [Chthonomonadaceae bacterium]|nr:N-acetyl-gamma-glutamyl-phosphate reductase [Chthonomonadaceae bacterium]
MLDVAVVGASGYGGGELLRLLARHPRVTLRRAFSETYAGKPLSAGFPGWAKQTDLCFESYGDGAAAAECDVVFLAQENGKAMEMAPRLLEAGCKVIDLSADFRFRDTNLYESWYKMPHAASEANKKAVYGLPEIYGEAIRSAPLVGNPGCYPTAAILALAPLLHRRVFDPESLIVDAKSGVSGAGRAKFSLDYHFPEVAENVSAYKIAGTHRHTPEIEQVLSDWVGIPLRVTFTPHLIPMARGILATCYANLREPVNTGDLITLYEEFYANAPFVAVVSDPPPATKHTLGSNMCHIGLAVDKRTNRVTVVSAIDNLVKGAAGQAVQNMNLMCGFAETDGLDFGGLWP